MIEQIRSKGFLIQLFTEIEKVMIFKRGLGNTLERDKEIVGLGLTEGLFAEQWYPTLSLLLGTRGWVVLMSIMSKISQVVFSL